MNIATPVKNMAKIRKLGDEKQASNEEYDQLANSLERK
jgi:hypothetical protein